MCVYGVRTAILTIKIAENIWNLDKLKYFSYDSLTFRVNTYKSLQTNI
jgi:hypothetical protein